MGCTNSALPNRLFTKVSGVATLETRKVLSVTHSAVVPAEPDSQKLGENLRLSINGEVNLPTLNCSRNPLSNVLVVEDIIESDDEKLFYFEDADAPSTSEVEIVVAQCQQIQSAATIALDEFSTNEEPIALEEFSTNEEPIALEEFSTNQESIASKAQHEQELRHKVAESCMTTQNLQLYSEQQSEYAEDQWGTISDNAANTNKVDCCEEQHTERKNEVQIEPLGIQTVSESKDEVKGKVNDSFPESEHLLDEATSIDTQKDHLHQALDTSRLGKLGTDDKTAGTETVHQVSQGTKKEYSELEELQNHCVATADACEVVQEVNRGKEHVVSQSSSITQEEVQGSTKHIEGAKTRLTEVSTTLEQGKSDSAEKTSNETAALKATTTGEIPDLTDAEEASNQQAIPKASTTQQFSTETTKTSHLEAFSQTITNPIPQKVSNSVKPVDHQPPSDHFNWKRGDVIGTGSYGTVYMGLDQTSGAMLAIKEVLIVNSTEAMALQQEIQLMKTLAHPNIVRYIGCELDTNQNLLRIFTEWVPGGSISSVLQRFGALGEHVVKRYTAQVVSGLCYLHSNNIVHRDIKGANILVDDQGVTKLADFGASQRLETGTNYNGKQLALKGTPFFMAPEVISQSSHGKEADIWSIGCTVLQMFTGQPPWKQHSFKSMTALLYHICNTNSSPEIPLDASQVMRNFLNQCFQRDLVKRATAEQLLSHPFLTNKGESLGVPSSGKATHEFSSFQSKDNASFASSFELGDPEDVGTRSITDCFVINENGTVQKTTMVDGEWDRTKKSRSAAMMLNPTRMNTGKSPQGVWYTSSNQLDTIVGNETEKTNSGFLDRMSLSYSNEHDLERTILPLGSSAYQNSRHQLTSAPTIQPMYNVQYDGNERKHAQNGTIDWKFNNNDVPHRQTGLKRGIVDPAMEWRNPSVRSVTTHPLNVVNPQLKSGQRRLRDVTPQSFQENSWNSSMSLCNNNFSAIRSRDSQPTQFGTNLELERSSKNRIHSTKQMVNMQNEERTHNEKRVRMRLNQEEAVSRPSAFIEHEFRLSRNQREPELAHVISWNHRMGKETEFDRGTSSSYNRVQASNQTVSDLQLATHPEHNSWRRPTHAVVTSNDSRRIDREVENLPQSHSTGRSGPNENLQAVPEWLSSSHKNVRTNVSVQSNDALVTKASELVFLNQTGTATKLDHGNQQVGSGANDCAQSLTFHERENRVINTRRAQHDRQFVATREEKILKTKTAKEAKWEEELQRELKYQQTLGLR